MKNDENRKVELQYAPSERSFLIRISYRQNASWQGNIQWLDGRKTRSFRSFLEMVLLMQEALMPSDAADAGIRFHSWSKDEDVS